MAKTKDMSDPSSRTTNLPMPDEPSRLSEFRGNDMRRTGKGSGAIGSSAAGDFERDPVAKDSSARVDGRAMHKRTL